MDCWLVKLLAGSCRADPVGSLNADSTSPRAARRGRNQSRSSQRDLASMLTWLGRLRDWQVSLTVEDGGLGCPRGPEVVTVTAWWVGGSRRDRLHRGRRSRPTWRPIPRGPPTREGARNSGSWRLSSRRRRRHTRPSHLRSCSGPDRPRGGHRHREQGRRSGACGPRMTKPRMATADRAVRCSRLARQDTAHPGWTVLRSGEVTVHPRPLRLSDRSPAGIGPNVPNRRPGDHSRPV